MMQMCLAIRSFLFTGVLSWIIWSYLISSLIFLDPVNLVTGSLRKKTAVTFLLKIMIYMKQSNSWFFVCYVQAESKFVIHTIAVPSFFQALSEHKSLFANHSVVFCLQIPVYLAEYLGGQLHTYFSDYDRIYKEFARCVNFPVNSMIVSQVKTYQGLIPLSWSDSARRFSLASWQGEYYDGAQAFVLHVSLIEFFNSIFFTTGDSILNMFKNE
jgi:hypothetical protein